MTPSEILVEAYQRGRAWNPDPEFANLLNLDPTAVEKMDGSEGDAKLLVRSLQLSDANYNPLVLAFHQREPDFDGEIGPATATLVEIPRCPIPDFAPPPNAAFHYDDPELQAAVESMQANATGSGSWPSPGCDPMHTGSHSIRVGINTSNAPGGVMAYIDKALAEVSKCYADMGLIVRYLLNKTDPVEIRKSFASLRGGIIGINYFPTPGTCSQTITGQLSSSYAPSNWMTWARLETHETGHGTGLNHTNGGIMNPSILVLPTLTWRGDPSERTLTRFFGGVPVGVPTDPTDPVPMPNPFTEFVVDGVAFEVRKKVRTQSIEV
jgi:hypothetical protein